MSRRLRRLAVDRHVDPVQETTDGVVDRGIDAAARLFGAVGRWIVVREEVGREAAARGGPAAATVAGLGAAHGFPQCDRGTRFSVKIEVAVYGMRETAESRVSSCV